MLEYKEYNSGPYIRFLGFDLFVYRRPYWSEGWSLNADGAFAICTPAFTLYLPLISMYLPGIGRRH